MMQATIQHATANPEDNADDIHDPVFYVVTAVEDGLDELDCTTERTRSKED